jgi:carboxyl-terminal processing protease
VQRPLALPDGSMIRLTTARYYTPSGRCIQKPYTKGDKNSYNKDVLDRFNRGELTNADSIHFPDSLRYFTLKEQRTVYGGGGIMPDFFVPLDTTRYNRYHRELSAKGAIVNANLRYIDKNRRKLQREYKTFEDFKQHYEAPEELTNLVMEEGKKKEVLPLDENEKIQALPELRLMMKALVARDLWDVSEYYSIMYEKNACVQKAIEILQQKGSN